MLAALRQAANATFSRCFQESAGIQSSLGGVRYTSAIIRRRRKSLHNALSDPGAHPAKIRKLRERAARPSHDLLRYIAENKVAKVQSQADRKQLWYDLRYKKYAPTFIGQVKPRMRFWTAALEESQLPLARLPEVAVCGRSNSGKSTLLNYLCGRHSAHVKRMPGSTTELVFWQVGRPAQICLVDLPGYGFAYAPEEKRLQWTEFTLWYVRARKNLKRVLLLIDSRQGLKPSDKEMIAYLERHSVPWQIVVTKCDQVKGRELSKRLTVLQEDLEEHGYRRMAGEPIPVSALKRKGMDALRATLDSMKVMKEVVKDGIKLRVYDLLEQRRVQRAEKSRRRRERKALAAAEAEAAAAAATASTSKDDGSKEDGFAVDTDLHSVLSDWDNSSSSSSRSTGVGKVNSTLNPAGTAEEAPKSPPAVSDAHYSLEDRDSRRVNSMVHSLFPDLADFANIAQTADSHSATSASPTKRKATSDDAFLRSSTAPQHSILAVETPDLGGTSSKLHSRELEVEDPTLQQSIDDVDVSDDEEELLGIKPQVQRFEPTPFHASGGRSQGSKTGRRSGGRAFQDSEPLRDAVASPFPGLGSRPKSPQGATSPISDRSQVGLRHGWLRPPSKLDQIYEQDDFASPQDYAAGFRKYAPPAPSLAEPGSYMAQARRRYEREWAMELQDVDQARSGSPDVGSSSSISAKKKQQKTEVVDDMPPLKMPFVTQEGLKEIAKGHGKWKFLGRILQKSSSRRERRGGKPILALDLTGKKLKRNGRAGTKRTRRVVGTRFRRQHLPKERTLRLNTSPEWNVNVSVLKDLQIRIFTTRVVEPEMPWHLAMNLLCQTGLGRTEVIIS
eukprot:TRINITY_DN9898_c0_g1_i4.p1 TRINITY_DN9898_c0_g1~~TRINITY_DN9898_c0_g1_i4.p1  ORF type:complete len:842 (+),score=179.75 TRINITY_DN9898_c0_g1_i4:129-2654(+)